MRGTGRLRGVDRVRELIWDRVKGEGIRGKGQIYTIKRSVGTGGKKGNQIRSAQVNRERKWNLSTKGSYNRLTVWKGTLRPKGKPAFVQKKKVRR